MYDVIIIGSGPAGLTAAIYTTRANLKTLIIAGSRPGGQLQLTSLVENFPGFPSGIQGPELMGRMREQAEKLGAEVVDDDFESGKLIKSPFQLNTAGGRSYEGRSVIIATGAEHKWLGVKGEAEKIGKGVSTCATCDGGFFRNKKVAVVGGGDSAMEEALVLSKIASEVYLIHRKDTFRASKIMQERVMVNSKIKILYNSIVDEITGVMKVEGVRVRSVSDGSEKLIDLDGVFVAIGHMLNTKKFTGIGLDNEGYVVNKGNHRTSIDGVFTAGDVHDKAYRQAIIASGYGASAALEVEKWLER